MCSNIWVQHTALIFLYYKTILSYALFNLSNLLNLAIQPYCFIHYYLAFLATIIHANT